MLNIFICEDDEKQRSDIKKIIEDILQHENYEMKIAVSTDDPKEVLNYLKNNVAMGIYFLDLNLNNKINGFDLAKKIRKYDSFGFVIFITGFSNMMPLTFTYMVEAIDCIDKNSIYDISENIRNSLIEINNRYALKDFKDLRHLTIKCNDRIIKIDLNKIIYIESLSSCKKILLHCEDREIEFFGNMKAISKGLDNRFYECDEHCMVNKDKVKEIDKINKIIYFIDGDSRKILKRKLKYSFNKRLNFFQK